VWATMTSAIADLARRGFTTDLRAVDGALRTATGETLWPRDLVIRAVHRFEGVSDPDDTEVLFAIDSVSGVRGTLADAFGVYATPLPARHCETPRSTVSAVLSSGAFKVGAPPNHRQ
jgi:hypothetical protein